MARRRTRSTARRASRSSYAPRRSTGRRTAQRSSRSRARSSGSRRAAPRQGRIVIEVVQSGAVRAPALLPSALIVRALAVPVPAAQHLVRDGSSLKSSSLVPFVPASLSLSGRRLHPHLA